MTGPGVSAPRVYVFRGVPGPGQVVFQHALRQTPPDRILDTLLKILLCPKLRLRAVTKKRATHKLDQKVPEEMLRFPEDRHCRSPREQLE